MATRIGSLLERARRVATWLLAAAALCACASAPDTAAVSAAGGSLLWPIDCEPGVSCGRIGTPDPDGDGRGYDCRAAGYRGHEGTDIAITPRQMEAGVAVRAAAAGEVKWVFDGKDDRCPGPSPDCAAPPRDWFEPGASRGYRVCTELGPYCRDGAPGDCFWCFDGGNVVVVLHEGVPGVFATRYDHFKRGSIRVRPGDRVAAGQVIGEVGSAGHSSAPHLHFEVWGATFYDPVDPWSGRCGGASLWRSDPPWEALPAR